MVQLNLIGPPQLIIGDRQETRFPLAKVLALLAYLALADQRTVARDELVTLLWPDSDSNAGRQNLSQTLVRLRRLLEPADALLVATRATIALAADLQLDVAEFHQRLDAVAAHTHSERARCAVCQRNLRAAVQLVRGELLAGLYLNDSLAFDEWLLLEREAINERYLTALTDLADDALAIGDYRQAIDHARRQLALLPWSEQSACQLMTALALAGRAPAALAEYDRLVQVLDAELALAPSPGVQQLAADIRAGRLRPPAAAAPPPPTQRPGKLPRPLTPFIGREQEITQFTQRLTVDGERLLSLVGPGGIGKTRLAIEVAQRVAAEADGLQDGAWFVALGDIDRPDAQSPDDAAAVVAEAVASVLAAPLALDIDGGRPVAQTLPNTLRAHRLLLVLDNCEHLLAAGEWLLTLLAQAPGVQLLVTSREPLRLLPEDVWRLGGLPVPPDGLPPAAAADFGATRLYLERVRRQDKQFHFDAATWPHIVRTCRLLDGLPLGIELAATWIGSATPAEIADLVAGDAGALAARMPGLPAHQRSLVQVFEQSWQRLTGNEQRALARLAVLHGSFNLLQAQAVATTAPATLERLRDKSLLRAADDGRLALHDLVRQFARGRLAALPAEQSDAERRHAAFFLHAAEHYYVAPSAQQVDRAAELIAAIDNLDAAWRYACRQRATDLLLPAIEGVAGFFYNSSRSEAALRLMRRVQTAYRDVTPAAPAAERLLLARALIQEAVIARDLGDVVTYEARMTAATALLPAVDIDVPHAAHVHATLAWHQARAASLAGDASGALARLQTALPLAQRAADRTLEANILRELSYSYRQRGDYLTYRDRLCDVLAIHQARGDTARELMLLLLLGGASTDVGDYWPARAHLLAVLTRNADPYPVASAEGALARVETLLGRPAAALERHQRSLAQLRELDSLWRTALALIDLAQAQAFTGDLAAALTGVQEAEVLARGAAFGEMLAMAQLMHGLIAAQGDLPDASARLAAAIAQNATVGRQIGRVEAQVHAAALALRHGQHQRAAELAHAALPFVAAQRLDGASCQETLYAAALSVATALGAPQTDAIVARARAFVDAVAAPIDAPAIRQAYLNSAAVRQLLVAA